MNTPSNNISLLPFTPSTFPKISLALLLQSHAHLSMLQATQGSFQLYHIYVSLGFSTVDSHSKKSLVQIYLICIQRACLMLEVRPQYFQMSPAILYNQLNFLDSMLSFLDSMLLTTRSTSTASDASPAFHEFRNEVIVALQTMKIPVSHHPAQPLPQHHSFTLLPTPNTPATPPTSIPVSQLQYQSHFVPFGYYPATISSPVNNDAILLPPLLNFMPPHHHFFPSSSPPTSSTSSTPSPQSISEDNSSMGDNSSDNLSFKEISPPKKQKNPTNSIKSKRTSPNLKSENNLHGHTDRGLIALNDSSSNSLPLKDDATDVSLNAFLAHIRKTGVDFISPMNLQDIVLACIFSILKEFKCFNIKDIIDRLVLLQSNNLVPELNTISKTKIRGLIALMRHCDIIVLEDLDEEEIQILKSRNINRDIRLNLSKNISSLKDLRRVHDDFLISYGQSNNVELSEEALCLVIWDSKKMEEKNYYHGLETMIERNRTFFQQLTSSSAPGSNILETSVLPAVNTHKSISPSVVHPHQNYSQDKPSHKASLSSASTVVTASQSTPYPLILINPTTYQPTPSPYIMYPYPAMRVPTYSAFYPNSSHCITSGYYLKIGSEGY